MRALGIESSCDETAAAVVTLTFGEGVSRPILQANVVHGQVEVHARYGGVVPELASRAHIRNIGPVIAEAFQVAGITPDALDCVAVTAGPGLIGGLLTGMATAKGLAMALGVPLVGVHHMEGHLMSPFLDPDAGAMDFPFVSLLVSGGHTLLVHARQFGEYRPLGRTRDDAVGEAFDKGARLLGLGYPGGPAIATLAEGGDREAIRFPRAMPGREQLDFSFSGLKTALRTFLGQHQARMDEPEWRRDVAASYQEAIVDVLASKSIAACRQTGERRLVVAGGVGANRRLRERLLERGNREGIQVYFPPLSLCTDNGAMIALAGLRRLAMGQRDGWALNVQARWPVEKIGETFSSSRWPSIGRAS
ncbi:MAG: tRNA (adenosine(37)-N6)-threonylcarbamoyltransferase complex transferase subunit TsaD [Magnetococcales bacterium]|nr:tRNA (adenosine(37)-N6)-threonylcarbamoyltransferase complex transferase subunit TsaD [Magnetococcales bacterium]